MAQLSRNTVVFDIDDCKVYALLTDPTGAPPTYGAAIDVPGISQVSLDPNFVTAELKGDGQVIAKRGRIDKLGFSCTYGKLSLDVLDILIGSSTVTSGGVTPNRTQVLMLAAPSALAEFKIEFRIVDLDQGIGSLNVVLYRCVLTGGTLLGGSTDQFGQPSFTAEAVPVNGTVETIARPMARISLHETASAVSA